MSTHNYKDRSRLVAYRHIVVHQRVGVHDGDQLVQEVWLGLKQLRGQLLHDAL